MRVIIAGSRGIQDEEALRLIEEAVQKSGWQIDEVISGAADGLPWDEDGRKSVDTMAIEWAKANFIDYAVFPANWKKYNKAAGYKRNQKMAWYARIVEEQFNAKGQGCPEKYQAGLIAIWNHKSSGTKHMINIADEMGVQVFIWPKISCSQESSEASESPKENAPSA